MRTGDPAPASEQSGFALMALLLIVAVSGLALAAAAQVWSTTSRRDKEDELLRIGTEFRQAIRSYALSSPGAQQYPQRLEDLVLDPRFPFVKRHLRRIYADPLTGEAEWGLVMAGEAIVGVHSLASGSPLKTALDPDLGIAEDAQTYGEWIFAYRGDAAASQGAGSAEDPESTFPPPRPGGEAVNAADAH